MKIVCRLLIALMIWMPYQFATAGMIGTEQVVSASSSQADRAAILSFVNRSDVASQLQSMGIDPSTANARVAALSDQEAKSLAGTLQTAPAGADTAAVVWTIVIIAIVAVVVWYLWKRV